MPRLEQTVAYSISPVVPTTTGKLPKFATTGNPSKATDSVFGEDDNSHRILIGIGAGVNAGQAANGRLIVIGEGATGWGDDIVVIGRGATSGQTAAKDGAIVIGQGATANAKNVIRIGSSLAFGAGAGDDSISLGTQAAVNGNASIAIGRGTTASTNGIAIGHTASTNGTTEGIAIGHGAAAANTGVNHQSIALGNSSSAGVNNGQSAIAIGLNAQAVNALASKLIAIGEGATITGNVSQAIAIGAGAGASAAVGSNEVVFGDSLNGNQIAIFTLRTLAGNGVKHRSGADGSWSVVDLANVNTHLKVDASAVAEDMRLLLWDVTAAVLKRVSRGGNGVAPAAGFRCLQIPA